MQICCGIPEPTNKFVCCYSQDICFYVKSSKQQTNHIASQHSSSWATLCVKAVKAAAVVVICMVQYQDWMSTSMDISKVSRWKVRISLEIWPLHQVVLQTAQTQHPLHHHYRRLPSGGYPAPPAPASECSYGGIAARTRSRTITAGWGSLGSRSIALSVVAI